jgi:hypothetical protein
VVVEGSADYDRPIDVVLGQHAGKILSFEDEKALASGYSSDKMA